MCGPRSGVQGPASRAYVAFASLHLPTSARDVPFRSIHRSGLTQKRRRGLPSHRAMSSLGREEHMLPGTPQDSPVAKVRFVARINDVGGMQGFPPIHVEP